MGIGALVAPDQSGSDDFVVFIEQDGAVHLAGKTYGGDGFASETRDLQRFADSESGGAPPVAGILLGPAGHWAGEVGVLFRARGEHCTVFIENESARSAGSDVDAEDWNTASFLRETCRRCCLLRPFGEEKNSSRNQTIKVYKGIP